MSRDWYKTLEVILMTAAVLVGGICIIALLLFALVSAGIIVGP